MKSLKTLLLPLACFLAIVGAAHLHIVEHRQSEDQLERELVRKACISRAAALRAVLDGLARAPEGLAVLIAQGVPVEGRLSALSPYFKSVFPALGSLGLAPGGVLSEVSPAGGHECARGLDFLSDPRCR